MLRVSELNRRKIHRKKKKENITRSSISRFVTTFLSNLIKLVVNGVVDDSFRTRLLSLYRSQRLIVSNFTITVLLKTFRFDARYFHTDGRRHLDTTAPPVT